MMCLTKFMAIEMNTLWWWTKSRFYEHAPSKTDGANTWQLI